MKTSPTLTALAVLTALACGTSSVAQQAAPAAPARRLTLEQAVTMSLGNNLSIKIERLTPEIRSTAIAQELAVFDPVLTGQVQGSTDSAWQGVNKISSDTASVTAGVEKYFPSGTTVRADVTGTETQNRPGADAGYVRGGVTVTQALLRGFGAEVNMVRVQQARLDSTISEFEFRGFTESLVAAVEDAYWQYVLTGQQVSIVEKSLAVAERQLEETKKRIELGALAPTEQPAAEAEVAGRRQNLIEAQSAYETARISLVRLLNPPEQDPWSLTFALTDPLEPAAPKFDPIADHVKVAQKMRPEMNQARLLKQRNQLEVVRTRNGLLPQLDLFITLGRSGYAESFYESVNSADHDYHDVTVGARLVYAFGQRAEQAQWHRSLLSKQQADESLVNLAQLVEVDVRTAMVEVNRTREQIAASAATLRLREESLRVETEKLRIGKSTSLLVAQAQRDVLVSQVAEVGARVNYRRALTAFYRLEGTLLIRHQLEVSGSVPVED